MLTVKQRSDGWWIVWGHKDDMPCGPYDTRTEAESDRRGMERFVKYQDKPGFITSEKKQP